MKLPRDIDARQLIKVLCRLGYQATRPTGSHIHLACNSSTPHALTVPNHSPIKAGTLNAILADVAAHQRVDKAVLIDELFG